MGDIHCNHLGVGVVGLVGVLVRREPQAQVTERYNSSQNEPAGCMFNWHGGWVFKNAS